MTKDQKNEVIEILKGKFSQFTNFYITDTESLTVAQIGKLRRACFDKNVEMKVAKNTLIRKALESLDAERYAGVYERPVMKAAFINGDVYMGDKNLKALTQIKTKNELIGEVIGLLQSPAKRVLAALLHHHEKQAAGTTEAAAEAATEAPAES